MSPELNADDTDVNVWVTLSRLVTVTVAPGATANTDGEKAKFLIVTEMWFGAAEPRWAGGAEATGGPLLQAATPNAIAATAVGTGNARQRVTTPPCSSG